MNRAFLAVILGLITLATAIDPSCRGKATYKVVFQNMLTPRNFGSLIPMDGLVYSPLAGVSHSNRQSFLTVRGFASRAVEQIAETGVNTEFLTAARRLRRNNKGVKTVAAATGPTLPGQSTVLKLRVDCDHPFITVLGMIAPSPDWIVQINNRNLYDSRKKRFVSFLSGKLIAYDTGVDDGREFTPPLDLSLDMPTSPQKNIAPLVEDETDRFEGMNVGRYFVKRIR